MSKTKLLQVRLTPTEYDTVKKISKELDMSMSEYVRCTIAAYSLSKQDPSLFTSVLNVIGDHYKNEV